MILFYAPRDLVEVWKTKEGYIPFQRRTGMSVKVCPDADDEDALLDRTSKAVGAQWIR